MVSDLVGDFSMEDKKKENPKCSECSHTIKKRCRFGATIHCALSGDMMDVTHIVVQDGRTLLCPLLKVGE